MVVRRGPLTVITPSVRTGFVGSLSYLGTRARDTTSLYRLSLRRVTVRISAGFNRDFKLNRINYDARPQTLPPPPGPIRRAGAAQGGRMAILYYSRIIQLYDVKLFNSA